MQPSIKIDTSKALQALSMAPEALGNALRVQLKIGLRDIQEAARQDHRYISRSGNTDRAIAVKIDEPMKGRVELDTGISNAPYAPMLHLGTGVYGPSGKPFRVSPVNQKSLRFVIGGKFAFSRGHMIKGIKPDPFLYRAAERESPKISVRIDKAISKVIKESGL